MVTEPPPIGIDALLFLLLLLFPPPLLLLLLVVAKYTKVLSIPLLTQVISLRRYSRCFSNTMDVMADVLFFRACCDDLMFPL